MNKYIVQVTIVASGRKLGYIVYATNSTEADATFQEAYPGLVNNNFTYTIALSV